MSFNYDKSGLPAMPNAALKAILPVYRKKESVNCQVGQNVSIVGVLF